MTLIPTIEPTGNRMWD